ncbi:hypothetical protein KC930_01405 [Candidatus Saccharibacteria bacterium]|nr:hypothetical protein [Candidatus Saccharibacteria bacterium]
MKKFYIPIIIAASCIPLLLICTLIVSNAISDSILKKNFNSDFAKISAGIDKYKIQYGKYPSSTDDLKKSAVGSTLDLKYSDRNGTYTELLTGRSYGASGDCGSGIKIGLFKKGYFGMPGDNILVTSKCYTYGKAN